MTSIRKNIVANYLGKGWSVVSVYVFVPFYLHFLGVEAYGLVGFYAVLHGVLALSDMGLTAALSREMARLSAGEDGQTDMRRLVRTIELVYLGISAFVVLLTLLFAGPIAHSWLDSSSLPVESVEKAIRLMGFAVALQLPSQMYLGGLLGLQKQVAANLVQVFMGVVRSGGATLVLWLISPTIEAFFIWQILASVLLLLVSGCSVWASLPGETASARPSLASLKGVMGYSLGVAAISFNSIILMQIDKIAISKLLSLESLGYYTLASVLAQAPLLLSAPIAIAVFPQLTQLMAAGRKQELAEVYHRASQLVAAIVFPIGLTMVVFSHELLLLWTRSPEVANETATVASLLVIGSIVLSLQAIPFRLALAAAWTRLAIIIGVGSIIIIVPALVILIRKFGMLGAGMSWIALNSMAGLVLVVFVHRKLLVGQTIRVFARMAPYALTGLAFAMVGRFYAPTGADMWRTVITLVVVAGSSCLVSLLLYRRLSPRNRPERNSTG